VGFARCISLSCGAIGLCLKPPRYVGVSGSNQPSQRSLVDVLAWAELHMSHEPARAFQKTVRVRKLRPAKEADINVRRERIDISECGVVHACGGVTVVQELSNIVSAASNYLEPALRDGPQLTGMIRHPAIHRTIAPD
jgi:hypothetical protein